jgi:hypothetical protein
MDAANYVAVKITKPMGIVFEENDLKYGGIYIQSMKAEGAASKTNALREGDQLVAVDATKVSGLPFDEALGTITAATSEPTKLVFFRGSAKQLYGPTGASQQWLDDFLSKGGVEATAAA